MIDYAIVHYMASGDYQQVPKLIKELASRNRPDKVLSIIEGRLETLFPEMEGLGGIALRRLIPLEIYESLLSNLLPYVKDTFRTLYPQKVQYSWWSYRFNARKNNAGWRIDYWLASESLMDRVKDSLILTDIYGSDHCPVELDLLD